MGSYKAENQQLHKELSLLPPTYAQYRAVREGANSRRRQRTITATDASATPPAVSHPLNFHLHGRANAHDPPPHVDTSLSGPNGVAPEPPEKVKGRRGLEDDRERKPEEGGGGPYRIGANLGLNHEDNANDSNRFAEGSSAGKDVAEEEPSGGRGTDRRYSTLAR